MDTYIEHSPENPANRKEEERTYEDFVADLSREDFEILERKLLDYDYEVAKYKSKLEFARIKERDVKEFFLLLDTFLPADMQDSERLINLAEKIRNSYGL